MLWRIPIAVALAAFVAVSCDQAPTAAEDAATEVTGILVKADGNNGAVRWIPDPECAVFDSYGDFVIVDCRNQIATYSANGNANIVVKASGILNHTGRVVTWDAMNPPPVMLEWFGLDAPPAPCFVYGPNQEALFTVNWEGRLTPSGEATFKCHYAKKWEFQWPD
jgi:hypothetical protein